MKEIKNGEPPYISKENPSILAGVRILEPGISIRPASRFFIVMSIIIQIDLIINLYSKWSSLISRVLTVKEMILLWNALMGYFASKEGRKLLDYVRRHLELHKVHEGSTDREREIYRERDEKILKYNRFVSLLLTHIIHVLCAVIPFVAVLFSLYKSHMKGENFSNLPFIMHLYFPSVFDRSLAFQLVYQTSLYVWWSCMLYCWSVLARSVYFCFACMAAEIELFCLSLEEIGENESEEKLRKRLGKLVHEHQLICRNTEDFGRVSSKIIFGIVNLYGSQICIYLIFITLIDDIYVKVRYIICYAVVFAFIYFISWNGQIITDLGRQLKLTLFQSAWIDKPVWFRKTLLFMITRASKDILIRPFGLYVLGIDCIVTVCKGTYTYMNFANEMLR